METKTKVKSFILENFLFTDDVGAIDEADSFMEKGIVDSTGILEIIYFLEDEFGIEVKDDEMIPENLDSILQITKFIERKKIEAA